MTGAHPHRDDSGVRESAPVALDKSGAAIQTMFAGVARRYDLLNHLLSANLDRWWRRQAARALALPAGAAALDLCCGTGDQALAVSRRGARVAAADFCVPMLALARAKFGRPGRPTALAADALTLPFAAARFTGATVSFGLRNVADLDLALQEIARTLEPGGRLVVLECTIPESALLRRLYLRYFLKLLPWIGARISGAGAAYRYLPDSVLAFPEREAFLEHLRKAGFEGLSYRNLTGGTVCLYRGSLPMTNPPRKPTHLSLAEAKARG